MNHDYRLSRTREGSQRQSDGLSSHLPHYPMRTLLWILIAVGVVANTGTSLSGAHVIVSAGIGATTLGCVVVLVLHYLRHSKSSRS